MSTHAETDATDGARPRRAASGRTTSPSALGIGIAVFTLVSGVVPLITEWHNDNAVHREVFVNIPGPLKLAFYTVIPVMLVWGAFRFADRMKNWERGSRPRRRRTTTEEREAPLRRLPRRRLHADAAARPGRRADALDDLLRVPRAARRHDGARDRPPAARGPQVPARPHVPGVRVRRRRRRPRVHRRRGLGDPAPLRAAAVPHPHQDQARARRSSSARSSSSASPASAPRCSASRCSRPRARTWTTRSGASSAARSAQLVDGCVGRRRCRPGTSGCGSATSLGVHRVPRDPADHDAAPHVHVAAEHVPQGQATARRAR